MMMRPQSVAVLGVMISAFATSASAQVPEIVEFSASATRVTVGETVTINLEAENIRSRSSSVGYVSISFPQLNTFAKASRVSVGSWSGSGGHDRYPAGHRYIFTKSDQQMEARYLLVEGQEGNGTNRWTVGENEILSLSFTPTDPGTYEILGRVAIRDDDYESWVRAPESGSTDQQGYYAERITIEVTEPTPEAQWKGFTFSPSTKRILAGESFELRLQAENDGDYEGWGAISLQLPDFNRNGDKAHVEILSAGTSSGGRSVIKERGDQINTSSSTKPADHVLIEREYDTWRTGDDKYLKVRVTPRHDQANSNFRIQGRVALQKSDFGSYDYDPTSGVTDQQGFKAEEQTVTIEDWPSTDLGSLEPFPTSIQLGSAVNLRVGVTNTGGSAKSGHITFAFPDLTRVGDLAHVSIEPTGTSSGYELTQVDIGDTVYDENGPVGGSDYVQVEAAWTGLWPRGTTRYFNVMVTPQNVTAQGAPFRIWTRAAMQTGADTWRRDPTSGSITDQQGFRVSQRTVTVVNQDPPVPDVMSVSLLRSSMTVADVQQVEVSARNTGGAATSGSITLSVPQLTAGDAKNLIEYYECSDGGTFESYATGESIFHRDPKVGSGGEFPAEHLMVECSWSTWGTEETRSMAFDFKPQVAMTHEVRTRAAMQGDDGKWFGDESLAGGPDQQGWPVDVRTFSMNTTPIALAGLSLTDGGTGTLTEGVATTYRVDVSNPSSGYASAGSVTLYFPHLDWTVQPGTFSVRCSENGASEVRTRGQGVFHRDENQPASTLSGLFVECFFQNWRPSESRWIEVTVAPEVVGDFTVQYRAAARGADGQWVGVPGDNGNTPGLQGWPWAEESYVVRNAGGGSAPYVERVQFGREVDYGGGPFWEWDTENWKGVRQVAASDGLPRGVLFVIRNPTEEVALVSLQGQVVLETADTVTFGTSTPQSVPPGGIWQSPVWDFGKSYADISDNRQAWPATGIKGDGYLHFGLRTSISGPPQDSSYFDYPISFESACVTPTTPHAYRLRPLDEISDLHDSIPPLNQSVDSGRDVVLVHGYRRRSSFCETASEVDYWKLNVAASEEWSLNGRDQYEWPDIVKVLHEEGTRVWLYRWPTGDGIRAAGLRLARMMDEQARTGHMGDDVVIVGHSMGGIVSVHAMSDVVAPQRDRVSRLITLASPHNGSGDYINYGDLGQQFSAKEMDSHIYVERRRRRITSSDMAKTILAGGSEDQTIWVESSYDRSSARYIGYPGSSRIFDADSNTGSFSGYDHTEMGLSDTQASGVGVENDPAPIGGRPLRHGGELSDTVLALIRKIKPQPPIAELVAFELSQPSVSVGEPVDITLRVRNAGPTPSNSHSYLSIGFPSLRDAGDVQELELLDGPVGWSFDTYSVGEPIADIENGTETTATYLLAEVGGPNHEPGQIAEFKLRWTPTRDGNFVVEGRAAIQQGGDAYSRAPASGQGDANDQQGAAVLRRSLQVTPPPIAAIGEFTASANDVKVGDPVTLRLTATNTGGVANDFGYLSIGFPFLRSGTDASAVDFSQGASSTGTYEEYPAGTPINSVSGSQFDANYLLAELAREKWSAGETGALEVVWTPTRAGTFMLEGKLALQVSGETYSRSPDSGIKPDQQGAWFKPLTITVRSDEPAIGVNPGSLVFNATQGGSNPASQAVDITNVGPDGTSISDLSVGQIRYLTGGAGEWVESASLQSSQAPSTLTVAVSSQGLTAGTYEAEIDVESSAATNSPQTVRVELRITADGGGGGGSQTTLAQYQLDGSGQDASGNDRSATLIGGTIAHDRHGASAKAIGLDGTDDHLITAASDFLDTQDQGSISLWFRLDDPDAVQTLFTYSTDGGADSYLGVSVDQGVIHLSYKFGGALTPSLRTQSIVEAGRWHHLAVVADGASKTRIYLDGQPLQTTFEGRGTSADGSEWFADINEVGVRNHYLVLGALKRAGNVSNVVNGAIDDVQIFSGPLDSGQIIELRGSYMPGPVIPTGVQVRGTVGTPVSVQLQASGGTPPYTWSLSAGESLPAGLRLSSDGRITGTPSAAVTDHVVRVRATDAGGAWREGQATITIQGQSQPPAFCSASLAFTGGELPDGWTGRASRSASLANDRVEAYVTDGSYWIEFQNPDLQGAEKLTVSWRGQHQSATWGQSHAVRLTLNNGDQRHLWVGSSVVRWGSESIRMRNISYPAGGGVSHDEHKEFSLPFGEYEYRVEISATLSRFEMRIPGTGEVVAYAEVPGETFDLSHVEAFGWIVATTTDTGNWGDDLSVSCGAMTGAPAAISMKSLEADLTVDAQVQLTGSLVDESGNPLDARLKWTSDNPAVATVDPNGLVTARNVGNATITVSRFGFSATVPVNVTDGSGGGGGGGGGGVTFADDFQDGDFTANPTWTKAEPGTGVPLWEIVNGELHIKRSNAGGSGRSAGLYVAGTEIPVDDQTEIGFDIKVVSSSVRNQCGDACTEFPATVLLTLELAEGTEKRVTYAYNDDGGYSQTLSNGHVFVSRGDAPTGEWLRDEVHRIRDAHPTAVKITQVWIGGAGWDFDAWYDNVEIRSGSGGGGATPGITIDKEALTLALGAEQTLGVTAVDVAGNTVTDPQVTWSVAQGPTRPATVDATGRVRALAAGEIEVIATWGDFSDRLLVVVPAEEGGLVHDGVGATFSDDFSGGSIGSEWQEVSGTWIQADGVITGSWPVSDAQSDQANLLLSTNLYDTADATFGVRLGSGDGSGRWSLFAGAGQKYSIAFSRNPTYPNGAVAVEYRDGGNYVNLGSSALPEEVGGSESFDIVLDKSGSLVEMYVNGWKVLSFVDEVFNGETRVGLGAYGTATYDDFAVYGGLVDTPTEDLRAWVDDATARVGDEIKVLAHIDVTAASAAVGSLEGTLRFDPAVLAFGSVNEADFSGTAAMNTDNAAQGEIGFGLVDVNGANRNETSFLEVTFTLVGDPSPESTLDLTITGVSSVDFVDLAPRLAVEDGTVSLARGLWGDPSGDEKVSALDALICLSHAVGRDVTENGFDPSMCDVVPDGQDQAFNGKVSAVDALAILSHAVNRQLPAHFRVAHSR